MLTSFFLCSCAFPFKVSKVSILWGDRSLLVRTYHLFELLHLFLGDRWNILFCKVSLLMPDSPTLSASLRDLLIEDTQYYKVSNLHLHELCAPAFLQAFLNRGRNGTAICSRFLFMMRKILTTFIHLRCCSSLLSSLSERGRNIYDFMVIPW